MEFTELIKGRRSIRSYQDKPVERGELQAVIDTAVLAPSAVNSQPWEFWVILGARANRGSLTESQGMACREGRTRSYGRSGSSKATSREALRRGLI